MGVNVMRLANINYSRVVTLDANVGTDVHSLDEHVTCYVIQVFVFKD